MEKSWRHSVLRLATTLVKKQHTPLFFKSVSWQVLRFFSRCGKSNFLSFALRPIMFHNKAKSFIGILLVVGMMWMASFSPVPSFAADTGGPEVITPTVPEGETKFRTTLAIRRPMDNLVISQRYWLLHSGMDFRTPVGTNIYPLMAGTVALVKNEKYGYGNYIVIAHEKGYETLYAHLSKSMVKEGQPVTTDTILGLSGNTGRSTGPHLHFEVYEDGKTINPAPILGLR